MKLNENFITHNTEGKSVLISMDSSVFSGLIKLNGTAAFIVECLKEECDIGTITDKMTEEYSVDRAVAEKDITDTISKLRSVGAIDDN